MKETTTFKLQKDSKMRVNAFSYDVTLQLHIFNSQNETISEGTNNTIIGNLSPGEYTLEWTYSQILGGNFDCFSMYVELAILPSSYLSNTSLKYTCTNSSLPSVDLLSNIPEDTGIDIKEDYVIKATQEVTIILNRRVLSSLDFIIPETTSNWRIKASLSLDFLTGGSHELLLLSTGIPLHPSCLNDGSCIASTGSGYNEKTLAANLSPGNYTLYLIENSIAHSSWTLCIPFQYSILIEPLSGDIDPIACPEKRLPQNLNQPGYMTTSGNLQIFDEFYINLLTTTTIQFTLSKISYFRIYVAENAVDITVKVKLNSTMQPIISNNEGGQPESIFAYLKPGLYDIYIYKNGIQLHLSSCELFNIGIVISPISSVLTQCNLNESSPDFSEIQSGLDSSGSYILEETLYQHNFENQDFSQVTIQSIDLNITEPTVFYFEVRSNFLMGDMALSLMNTNNMVKNYGKHFANSVILSGKLYPGVYNLQLNTWKATVANFVKNNSPSCVQYTTKILVFLTSQMESCSSYTTLPSSLNSPSFLSTLDWVTIDSEFLLPIGNIATISISPISRSIITLRSRDSKSMVGISLDDGNGNTNFPSQGVLRSVLEVNHNYTLSFLSNSVSKCDTFNLQLDLEPFNNTVTISDCSSSAPSDSIFNFTDLPYSFTEVYSFVTPEGELSYSLSLQFEVNSTLYLFSKLGQNFGESYLSFQISDLDGKVVALPQPFDIIDTVLYPGVYRLDINQSPLASPLYSCISYSLSLYLERKVSKDSFNAEAECLLNYLPPTLNSIQYISAFSYNMLHLAQDFLVDLEKFSSSTNFSLNEPFSLRVLLAGDPSVNYRLKLIKDEVIVLKTDTTSINFSIYADCDANATYTLEITFYEPKYGEGFPSVESCTSYYLEIAIITQSFLDQQQIPTECITPTSAPPTSISSNLQMNSNFHFQRSPSLIYAHSINISIPTSETAASLEVTIGYHFLTGWINIYIISPSGDVIYPTFFQNHASLSTILGVGSYLLILEDETPQNSSLSSCCVEYNLIIGLDVFESSSCNLETTDLPNDLFSLEGGSSQYGGPQDPTTGVVLLRGFNVGVLPGGEVKDVSFIITEPSLLRVFTSIDISLDVYNTGIREIPLDKMSSSTYSSKWSLDPQDELFTLQFTFNSITGQDYSCISFQFELEIKPISLIRSESSCPYIYPTPDVPQSSYTFVVPTLYAGDFLFNSTYILDSRHIANIKFHNTTRFFEYKMTLDVRADGVLYSYIDYNFLVEDFYLILMADNMVLSTGDHQISENVQNYESFVTSIRYEVKPATYQLLILQPIPSILPGEPDNTYCFDFNFLISFSTTTEPQLLYINPPYSNNLSPEVNFVITIGFSEPIGFPSEEYIVNYIITQGIFFLITTNGDTLTPDDIHFHQDHSHISLVFFASSLFQGEKVELVYDISSFRTAYGIEFTNPFSEIENIYKFQSCECNGRGNCTVVDTFYVCDCDQGYAGDKCEACDTGYHLAADFCVQDKLCDLNSCNKHGTCKDAGGRYHCTCDAGYASSNGDFCNVCADGYSGYPNCTQVVSEKPVMCYNLAVLPSTFDTIGYLDYSQSFHIYEKFYVDISQTYHNIYFTITTPSAFRVVSENNEYVEVTPYLIENTSSGISVISSDLANSVGSIYEELVEGTYNLRLVFIQVSDLAGTSCTYAEIEIEILPLTEVSTICDSTSSPLNGETVTASINNDYHLDDAVYSYASVESGYFHSINIQIGEYADYVTPLIKVDISYEFVVGKIMAILEKDTNDHCGSTDSTSSSNCITGFNYFNQHMLEATLQQNTNYTLWLYIPSALIAEISSCAQYTFGLTITSSSLLEDEWNCPTSRPPEVLTAPQYMDPSGFLHIREDFYIPPPSYQMKLEITQKSIFRMAINAPFSISGTYQSQYSSTKFYFSTEGSAISTSGILQPATYTITLNPWYSRSNDGSNFCQTASFEVAIEPVSITRGVDLAYICSAPFENLPTMDSPLTAPTTFGIATENVPPYIYTAYYSNHTDNFIFSFQIQLTEPTMTFIKLESNFLLNNLYFVVDCVTSDSPFNLVSQNRYNAQMLRNILGSGTYTVSVYFDEQNLGTYASTCADFNFQVILSVTNQCVTQQAEVIPSSLNSVRFLAKSNRMTYSSTFLPALDFIDSDSILSSTSFYVFEPSILRLWLNPNGKLSIGVEILMFDLYTKDWQTVYDILPEHQSPLTLGLKVDDNINYLIRFTFSKVLDTDDCLDFPMVIAIGPVDPLPKLCPNNGSSNLPGGFPDDLPNTPYHYDSIAANNTNYMQQVTGKAFIYKNSFILDDYANFHFEMFFDFLSSDWEVTLVDRNTDSPYYATRSGFESVIHQVGLPPSSYYLTIMQKKNIDELVGCAAFNYKITITKYSASEMSLVPYQTPSLPSTFNTIGYLNFDEAVELSHFYFFDKPYTIDMELLSTSYFRIQVSSSQHHNMTVELLRSGTEVFTSQNSQFATLNPGTFKLQLTPSLINSVYYVQIKVNRMEDELFYMNQLSENTPNCVTTSLPTIPTIKEGTTYTFSEPSQTIQVKNPPTSLVTSFTVETSCYFFAHLQFQFLPNYMSLKLKSTQDFSSRSYDINEAVIYNYIHPGNYTLTLEVNVDDVPAHCIVYSLVIQISNSQQTTECFGLYNLPSNLNDEDGGSVPYGGPIQNDALFFLGPSFLISNQLDHSSSIAMTLAVPSMMAVLTHSSFSAINFQLIYSNDNVIQPIYTYTTSHEVQNVYDLLPGSYYLQIFDFSTNSSKGECAFYSLSIDLSASSSLSAPSSCESFTTPSSELQLTDGYGIDWVESYLPISLSNSTLTTHFYINQSSTINCVLSFNIFMVMGHVEITRGGKVYLSSSQYVPSNFYPRTNMLSEISHNLPIGDYSINLSFQNFNYTYTETFGCFPYTWNLQVTPNNNNDNPTIKEVLPASSNTILPGSDISLDIVFSEAIYVDGVYINNKNVDLISSAIYLMSGSAGSSISIYPAIIHSFGIFSQSSWRFVFSADQLVAGSSYMLALHPESIFNEENVPFVLQTTNIYRILDQCSAHSHYSTDLVCVCDDGYQGSACDTCADGYMGYPSCAPTNQCTDGCVNGECVLQVCHCLTGWTGSACDDCAEHFTGSHCSECVVGWSGVNCSQCAPHFTGSNCDTCSSHFTGPNCSQCMTGWSGSSCNSCAPHFIGADCNDCAVGWDGEECNVCNYRFSGTNCDQCVYPFTGVDCVDCADHYVGFNCSQCKTGWAGFNCEVCAAHYTGVDCNECIVGWDDPLNGCSVCADRFGPPGVCNECEYPFTGENCSECQGNFDGYNCDFCKLGWSGANCSTCANHFTGDNCNHCKQGWQGPSCDYCDDHYHGLNCDQCVNQWFGDECNQCPSNYQVNPGDCSLCASNFQGESCSECKDGFTGDDCSIPIGILTEETQIFENTTNLDDSSSNSRILLNVIIVVIVVVLIALVLLGVGACVIHKRRSTFSHIRSGPTLDLDLEGGIEMDTNPMINPDERQYQNEEITFNWSPPENNLISFPISNLEDSENEFDGALDLDDLDDFDPRASDH